MFAKYIFTELSHIHIFLLVSPLTVQNLKCWWLGLSFEYNLINLILFCINWKFSKDTTI